MKQVPTFRKTFAGPPRSTSFDGMGIGPDLLSEYAASTMPELSAPALFNDGVLGRESMLPPSGINQDVNPSVTGDLTDQGTGGAGSFFTVSAFGAKG